MAMDWLNRLAALGATAFGSLFVAAPAMAQDVFDASAYSNYAPKLDNGKYMAAAAGCAGCHASGADDQLLAGGLKMNSALGEVNVPNITKAKIGSWSNAEFLNAVMRGVAPDGHSYVPVFPYTSYAGMKPEDVLDIKAYLASLPSSDNVVEPSRLSVPYGQSTYWAWWKRSNLNTAAFAPGDGSAMDRGKYLVENVGACGECHTPRTFFWGLDHERDFQGEKSLTGAAAPDISKAKMAALGDPTKFTKAFVEDGKMLSGSPIADPVKQKLVHGWAQLTTDDRAAILSYLSSSEVKIQTVAERPRASCSASVAAAAPASSASSGDAVATAADQFLGKYCRSCHGVGERDESVFPIPDLASVGANPSAVSPGNRNQSRLYQSVASGRMPKAGGRPSPAELESLGAWIDSLGASAAQPQQASLAAPAARGREIATMRDFLPAILRDISDLRPEDRPYARYFSYREQFNSVFSCESEQDFGERLRLYQAGFNKILNSVSNGPRLIMPKSVPGTKDLITRIDLRDLQWSDEAWNKLFAEYQYAIDPQSDPQLLELAEQSGTKIPILRSDWFTSYAGKPSLYYTLLNLPEHISEFEKRVGVDVNRNILDARVVRAGFEEGASGVSGHNRMIERHDLPQGGYYWKSYDFAQSVGNQDLRRFPHGPPELQLPEHLQSFHHDGGEMIFTLPNGMQGYYLSTAAGKRLDVGPVEIVANRARPANRGFLITNAKSCFDCHADGVIAKSDQLRDFIKSSPQFSPGQQDILLKMYVEQSELDRIYDADRAKFVAALDQIGATERAPGGELKSLAGPEGAEIITWNSDIYENGLDLTTLAGEFDLSPEEFQDRIQRVRDGDALRLALDWLTQLRAGGKITRQEFELNFPAFVETLTDFKSYRAPPVAQAAGQAQPAQPVQQVSHEPPKVVIPEHKQAPAADQVQLAVKVDKTDVFVGDKLNFSVQANQACNLQVFYVETDGDVVEFPPEYLGPQPLAANEERRLPATGGATFDPAGYNETLVVYCSAVGASDRIDQATAKDLVGQATSRTRGLKLDAIAVKPALQLLTFNVQDKH